MGNERNEVIDYIRKLIRENIHIKNYKLPSEYFLATKFKITRSSVREVMSYFINRELIESHKGSGYFVRDSVNIFAIKALTENKKTYDKTYNSEILIHKFDANEILEILTKLNISNRVINFQDFSCFKKIVKKENKVEKISIIYINKKIVGEIDYDEIKISLNNFFRLKNVVITKNVFNISTVNILDIDLFDKDKDFCIKKHIVNYWDNQIVEISMQWSDSSTLNEYVVRWL
ncbi:hypothetical protein SLITO_v1c06610 [Spiroplasma litorale]|uniref:HTH gntR-type domain-containing protein n=1 Tax=Spiroplasma litorale TaxID=216942 RepID=A0A0K1W1V1_9MOLU|nr:GntR family transcriptional regulator [Spiroplasma litorale]AKX34290.1 hypothetical protein SLITO_v1c06610 [Spiroplasma litorale]